LPVPEIVGQTDPDLNLYREFVTRFIGDRPRRVAESFRLFVDTVRDRSEKGPSERATGGLATGETTPGHTERVQKRSRPFPWPVVVFVPALVVIVLVVTLLVAIVLVAVLLGNGLAVPVRGAAPDLAGPTIRVRPIRIR
jgi:hypothetical protein